MEDIGTLHFTLVSGREIGSEQEAAGGVFVKIRVGSDTIWTDPPVRNVKHPIFNKKYVGYNVRGSVKIELTVFSGEKVVSKGEYPVAAIPVSPPRNMGEGVDLESLPGIICIPLRPKGMLMIVGWYEKTGQIPYRPAGGPTVTRVQNQMAVPMVPSRYPQPMQQPYPQMQMPNPMYYQPRPTMPSSVQSGMSQSPYGAMPQTMNPMPYALPMTGQSSQPQPGMAMPCGVPQYPSFPNTGWYGSPQIPGYMPTGSGIYQQNPGQYSQHH